MFEIDFAFDLANFDLVFGGLSFFVFTKNSKTRSAAGWIIVPTVQLVVSGSRRIKKL
ncbi:hypothetical protein RV10_GL004914 [Enterococcus pallens]|nr:hypothetical protein RV10_GL004914 [Enterococcus pallens]